MSVLWVQRVDAPVFLVPRMSMADVTSQSQQFCFCETGPCVAQAGFGLAMQVSTVEILVKELGCPMGDSCWEKEKAQDWCQSWGSLPFRKKSSHSFDSLSDHLGQVTGAEKMMAGSDHTLTRTAWL